MVNLDCQGCGFSLEIPAGLGDGTAFGCGHCGAIMEYGQQAREFRWEEVDPYVRRHGSTRLNLWGSFSAGSLWLVILIGTLAERGPFNYPLFAAMAVPYLAVATWLVFSRARLSPERWLYYFLNAMGAYCAYLWVLFQFLPEWGAAVFVGKALGVFPRSLILVAGILVAFGVVLDLQYRRRFSQLPTLSGLPPRV